MISGVDAILEREAKTGTLDWAATWVSARDPQAVSIAGNARVLSKNKPG
jgi:hypothetical protein